MGELNGGTENSPIKDYLAGLISAEVALAQLLAEGRPANVIEEMVRAQRPVPETEQWYALTTLVADRMAILHNLASEIASTGGDHLAAKTGGVAGVAAFFDRAVQHSPEAAVALHSLGDPHILSATTAEIVEWLVVQRLIGDNCDVLDLGCGIGRMATALASRCRSVLGLDVSAGMIAEARRRCSSLTNVRIELTLGGGLLHIDAATFDLMLVVDSMPYMVQAGVADVVIQTAAAVLRPQGSIVLLNLSYRDDVAADQADLRRWARAYGLEVAQNGERPFRLWNGQAFVLRKVSEGRA